jgi:release factor glutamine methyltransferase
MLDRPLTVSAKQAELRARLAAAGAATPDLDARLLVLQATGLSHAALVAEPRRLLDARQAEHLERLARRRIAREPVSRIAGEREFYGRPFLIGPATLDPRPETESLVECALRHARGRPREPLRILDLGTGSGALLLSVLAELPLARGIGTDVSEEALLVAIENARRLGVAERASFVRANWTSAIGGQYDLILSNPPYIPNRMIAGLQPEVRDHDPHLALDGGIDGLAAYRSIAEGARPLLAPTGLVAVEIGAGQAEAVAAIFGDCGFEPVERVRDLAGHERVISFA